jgi:hypothetical protein
LEVFAGFSVSSQSLSGARFAPVGAETPVRWSTSPGNPDLQAQIDPRSPDDRRLTGEFDDAIK